MTWLTLMTEALVLSCPRSRVLVATIAAATTAGFGSVPAAQAAQAAKHQRVQPGAVVTISGMHCKVGLLLHHGKKVYAAIPASCSALPNDEGTKQDGCAAASAPIGTPGRIAGARHRGTLVYNSFTTMEAKSETSPRKCYFNDLALLKLKPADAKAARGAIPGLRSPKRVSHHGPASGTQLTSGSSTATAGATSHGGWLYTLSAAPTVAASDVGTPFVHGGTMFGMLTQIPQGVVMPSKAGLSNLHRALHLMRKLHAFRHLKLLKAGQRP